MGVYTVVYGRTRFWSGPYTPSHRLHIAFTSPQSGATRLRTERGRNFYQGNELLATARDLDAWARPDVLRFGATLRGTLTRNHR